MVDMTNATQILKDMRPKLFALGLALIAATIAAFVPVNAALAVPVLTFLSVAACAGFALMWRQAEEASREAQEVASTCALLMGRLVRLEQQLKAPAATPALRSSIAEVTGTVGLLGGVVRELARNVAAQNRDVADLKDTLKAAPEEPTREQAHPGPALNALSGEPSSAQKAAPDPEPSLLPATRKSTESELRRMRLVTQAFEADRIELHLQPIVALPQRKIRFYETLARLRLVDGTLLGPTEFLPVLERLGRAPEFDRRVLVRAVAVARHLVARGSEAIVGVNLSARSINEPGFLWTLIGLVDASQDIVGKIVLEIPQECWRGLDSDQKAALATLRDRGVPLSLDHAADLQFDARALADLGVRFMKLPADQMIAAAEEEDGRALGPELGVRDFASALRREGIKLVAEHVEREEIVPALIDLGIPLAQGFVFAAPRAVKADVLGASSPQQSSGSDEPRSFLRRAG